MVEWTFLPKNPDTVGPRVYFEGVLINELQSKVPAAFDYNFKKGEINIDECRNSDEYVLRARIAQRVNKADKKVLSTLFSAMSKGEVYEATLDEYYLGYASSEQEQKNWAEAWTEFAGDAVIATNQAANGPIAEHVAAKGHKVQAIKSESFVRTAQKMGITDIVTVLGTHGAKGRIECDATSDAVGAVNEVWDWCVTANMTAGKPKPGVRCFRQLMDGEGETLGYHPIGSPNVFIREDVAGKLARKTAIEEVAHYITGSTDCSRDFQNFAFDMIVELCS
jgi:hypothetical protein